MQLAFFVSRPRRGQSITSRDVFAFDPLRTPVEAVWGYSGKMTETQLWATVNEYLRLHGDDACIFAAQRADELLEQGDHEAPKVGVR